MKKTTVIIADDHPLLARGLSDFLGSKGFDIIGMETNGIRTYHEIIKLQPELAVIDIEMPDMSGLQIMEKVLATGSRTKFIFITIHREASLVKRCFEAGLQGFLLKECSFDEILDCIKLVLSGQKYYGKQTFNIHGNAESDALTSKLTPGEIKILRYIAREYSTKEIAEKLFIAEKTVEKHRSNIIRKLDLPPRKNALLMWAINHPEFITSA